MSKLSCVSFYSSKDIQESSHRIFAALTASGAQTNRKDTQVRIWNGISCPLRNKIINQFVDVLYTDRPFPYCVVKIICTLQLRLRQREKRFLETRKLSSFISASGNTDFYVLETVSETAVLRNQKKQLISNATL